IAPGLAEPAVLELAARFREWVAQPEIAAALRRAAYPAGARVERESRFVHRAGDAIVEGIIDRLVLWGADGRVEGAEVLGFKTDAIESGGAEALPRGPRCNDPVWPPTGPPSLRSTAWTRMGFAPGCCSSVQAWSWSRSWRWWRGRVGWASPRT